MTESIWTDPQGNPQIGDAYDILMKLLIGEEETKKLELTPDGNALAWIGTGGAEAKDAAMSELSGRKRGDAQNDTDLINLGWSKTTNASLGGLGMWLKK